MFAWKATRTGVQLPSPPEFKVSQNRPQTSPAEFEPESVDVVTTLTARTGEFVIDNAIVV
jgi:hypothetical protein